MEQIVNKEFTWYLSSEDRVVNGVIHSVSVDHSDFRNEEVGHIVLSLEGSETYQQYTFSIWGNGEASEEYKNDPAGCYLCLPTMLEASEEDELEDISIDDMLIGIDW